MLSQKSRKAGQRLVNPFYRFCCVYPRPCIIFSSFPKVSSYLELLKAGTLAASSCFLPAPIPAESKHSLSKSGHWDAEREGDLPTVTQRTRVWAVAGTQAFCQTCVLWRSASRLGCLGPAMAPDPTKPSSFPPAPLGPPNSGLRACGGWPEAWESGQSRLSLRPLPASAWAPYHAIPSPPPSGEQLWGDHGPPFWGRLSQGARVLIFRARVAVMKFKVIPLSDILLGRKLRPGEGRGLPWSQEARGRARSAVRALRHH